jgi:hypothetical protein
MPENDSGKPEPTRPAGRLPEDRPSSEGSRAGSWVLRGVLRGLRHLGQDLISVAVGRVLEPPELPPGPAKGTGSVGEGGRQEEVGRRIGMLHTVTQQLRGAADQYLAAKLDEIEARVDRKLEEIRRQIDDKIVELHDQLADMRDKELRHRLRLLKITLIFTVLVALLSLGYHWAAVHWFS